MRHLIPQGLAIALAFSLVAPASAQVSTTNIGGWNANHQRNNSPNSPSASGFAAAATGAVSQRGGDVNVDARQGNQYAIGLPSYAAASGPCTGVSTFGTVGAFGAGIGGGRPELEAGCQVREAARLLAAMGQIGEATALIRSLPSVRAILGSAPSSPTPTMIAEQPLPSVGSIARWCWNGGVARECGR